MPVRRQAPHLTEGMRDAAYRYADRAVKTGTARTEALEEGKRLARLGLVKADGSMKRRKAGGAPTTVSAGKGKAPADVRVTAADRAHLRRLDPKASGVTLARDPPTRQTSRPP